MFPPSFSHGNTWDTMYSYRPQFPCVKECERAPSCIIFSFSRPIKWGKTEAVREQCLCIIMIITMLSYLYLLKNLQNSNTCNVYRVRFVHSTISWFVSFFRVFVKTFLYAIYVTSSFHTFEQIFVLQTICICSSPYKTIWNNRPIPPIL